MTDDAAEKALAPSLMDHRFHEPVFKIDSNCRPIENCWCGSSNPSTSTTLVFRSVNLGFNNTLEIKPNGSVSAAGDSELVSALREACEETQQIKYTLGGWSTGPRVVYGILAMLNLTLFAVGIMALFSGSSSAARSRTMLSASAFCAKLGFIVSVTLLLVPYSCRLGRWGCVTGVPSAMAIACVMMAVWIYGDEGDVAQVVSNLWLRLCRGCRGAGDILPVTRSSK
nr:unnamed protein product [Digitaria exilis]